jgi:hypothetical protein
MLVELEKNLHAMPSSPSRSVVEALIGAMNAGQVTLLSAGQRFMVQRAFLLHCPSST